jgi:integrase
LSIRKKNTYRAYKGIITRFVEIHGNKPVDKIDADIALEFLGQITDGKKKFTKRIRYSQLKSFFNFFRKNHDASINNPCFDPIIRKKYSHYPKLRWEILEKEVVDEVIFRTTKLRTRLILELMARGGMRIGEVLTLTPVDLQDRKLRLRNPKSGREQEFVFIPQKLSDRLWEYVRENEIMGDEHIFPISYEAARYAVQKSGDKVGIHLRPHDLRRHAATYASRSGVPLEIVSKVILRHVNIATTKLFNCIPS